MAKLTHFDEKGRSRMVDVSEKGVTLREAVAQGNISMKAETFAMIMNKEMKKGDVFEVARLAGIMAAKRTFELIPLCHPLNLTSVEVSFHPDAKKNQVKIESRVKVEAKTGVEMEALVAVSAAALTIYDMCKAVDRGMVISDIKLFRKSGGKSGVYQLKM
ncbi:MAG TPA: cyclic pyranopterin monophosphate synthase MoaC [Thermodesulfobacteriota bacterium]|nr:cyclic pyranopterin monophosphate synthase MoaC [Thermodesulfobacteriota bacterium]